MLARAQKPILYTVNTIGAIFIIIPLLWILVPAFETPAEIVQYPPSLIPKPFVFSNFVQLWTAENGVIPHLLLNSVLIAAITIAVVVIVSSLAGYGFAFLQSRWKNISFLFILSAMMVPFQAILIPLFVEMRILGWLNSYLALVAIYTTFILPFAVYMMRSAFAGVPTAIREAAIIDGAKELYIWSRVCLPLIWPALASVSIYAMYFCWNDFMIALVFTSSPRAETLTVGLNLLQSMPFGLTNWGALSAGVVVSSIPVMAVFLALQKYFIRGLVGGAVK